MFIDRENISPAQFGRADTQLRFRSSSCPPVRTASRMAAARSYKHFTRDGGADRMKSENKKPGGLWKSPGFRARNKTNYYAARCTAGLSRRSSSAFFI